MYRPEHGQSASLFWALWGFEQLLPLKYSVHGPLSVFGKEHNVFYLPSSRTQVLGNKRLPKDDDEDYNDTSKQQVMFSER